MVSTARGSSSYVFTISNESVPSSLLIVKMAESRSSTVPTEDPSNVSAQLGESGGDRPD